MFAGEGDRGEGQLVVPMAFNEIEVETSPPDDGVDDKIFKLNLRPPSPIPIQSTPFTTANGFGDWLTERLDPVEITVVYCKMYRYQQNGKIKRLLLFGKRKFRHFEWLHYVKGVSLIAVTEGQRNYVKGKFQREASKLRRKIINSKSVFLLTNRRNEFMN